MNADPNCLLDADFHAMGDPQGLWAWMRAEAPIYWHEAAEYPAFWSVTRHQDLRYVYANSRIFSSKSGVLLRPLDQGDDPGSGLTLALTDPPKHRDIRAIMAPFFASRTVQTLSSVVQSRARHLLGQGRENGVFDFSHDVAAKLTFQVTCDILGIPNEDHEMVFGWLMQAFEAGSSVLAQRECSMYLIDFIDRRHAIPADDLVSCLVHAKDADGERSFSSLEVLLNCENLLGATENAGLSLAGGVSALLDFPHQREMLLRDPDLLKFAVEEVLRWTSSATHSMRMVTEPTTIGSAELSAGDKVVVWLPSANRDETVFEAADVFNIRRRPANHISLGAGEHACIGGALARVEISVVLSELIWNNWNIERAGHEVPVRSIAVNGPASLPVQMI